MRVVAYSEARRILRTEGEGGHLRDVDMPKCVQRGILATRISDGTILVLVLRKDNEGTDRYGYERYTELEVRR
jgi:hypothetical protein